MGAQLGDEARALEKLEAAAAKAARQEQDQSFLNLMQVKIVPGPHPVLRHRDSPRARADQGELTRTGRGAGWAAAACSAARAARFLASR